MNVKNVTSLIFSLKRCCIKIIGWDICELWWLVRSDILIVQNVKCFVFYIILQSVQVKLWWPNGHGDQPFYQMTVRGFQDEYLILNTETKVRVHSLSTIIKSSIVYLHIYYLSVHLNTSIRYWIWNSDSIMQ